MTPFSRTRSHRCSVLALGVLACMHSSACGAYDVSEGRISGIRRAIDEATQQGAYRCAPRELAVARANLDFAGLELEQGNPRRAEEHLVEAETNIGAARLLSPPQRCEKAAAETPAMPGVGSEQRHSDADADGVKDAVDRCPSAREDWDGFQDTDGCPDPDNDNDGISDSTDACSTDAEDRDGFEDADGCPDRDNDRDGFEDPADDCPNELGVPENQGCPRKEYPGVTITEKELRLTTPIAFERSAPTIRSVSFTSLNTVVQVLADRPQMQLEIGGHTDSQGDDDRNMRESQERADAVKRYLTERGVDPSRLTARGYGETRPIESNSTSQGRAINRRIELVRTDRVR